MGQGHIDRRGAHTGVECEQERDVNGRRMQKREGRGQERDFNEGSAHTF